MVMPQVEPITKLARDHKALLSMLKSGPVFLAQRGHVSVVVLSPQDYEQLAEDARRWQRQGLADQRSNDLKMNPTLAVKFDEVEQGLFNA